MAETSLRPRSVGIFSFDDVKSIVECARFCHVKHASHATASLLGGMPRIPSFGTTGPYLKASFDESADSTGLLVVNAARLYMYAFMTHCDVCLRVGEPLGGASSQQVLQW